MYASVLILLIPTVLIFILIYFFIRTRKTDNQRITGLQLLISYFYMVDIITTIMIMIGAIFYMKLILDASLQQNTNTDFNIALASILVGIGLIIYLTHWFFRRKFELQDSEFALVQKRKFNFFMLITTSIIAIISIALTIFDFVNYYFPQQVYRFSNPRVVPTATLAITIVLIIVWVLYLIRFYLISKKGPDINKT